MFPRFINRLADIIPLFVIAAMLGAGFFIHVADLPDQSFCYFRSTLHMDCPGCGLTRAFVLIPQGRWGEVWRLNPAALPLYFFFAYVFIKMGWEKFKKNGFPWALPERVFLGWVVGILGLLLFQWSVKVWDKVSN